MKEHILKLASKVAVLFNDGIITKQEMSSISSSLRHIYRYLVKAMYRPPSLSDSSSSTSSTGQMIHPISTISCFIPLSPEAEANRQHEIILYIFELLQEFQQFLLPILSLHMSVQNSSRLTSLINFFQEQNGLFFSLLLFSDDYKEERNQFKSYAKYLPAERK